MMNNFVLQNPKPLRLVTLLLQLKPTWLVILPVFLAASVATCGEPRLPNIVILLADDLGYGELGCQGNPQIPTPNIDSIAQRGIRFTDGYVTGAYCSTSRAGLMSGRYQNRFGYEFNPIGAANEDPRVGLPTTERTLAEQLHARGYITGLIGKWHLGGAAPHHPYRRGFDEFFGFTHEGHYFVPPPYKGVTTMLRRRTLPGDKQGRLIDGRRVYSTHMGGDEPAYDANNPITRGGQPVAETEYLTDAFTREAVDFIQRHKRQPFFLYLAYNAVHSPLQAQDKYMKRFSNIDDIHRRIFAGMLANLDDSVGKVLETLKQCELEQDTLVFFLSDNGGPTRELTSSNKPLRGGKGEMFEGGIRVPFMVRWVGKLPAGTVYRRPVISLDIYATASKLAGAPLPDRLDGVDLLPYLSGKTNGRPHDILYWRAKQRSALRNGDWKIVRNPRRGQDAEWQLFDLANDLGEQADLAASKPEKLKELTRSWDELNQQMIAPIWP